MPNRYAKRYAVGIDGGTDTGIAIWDRKDKKFIKVTSEDFWTVYELITENYSPDNTDVYIEDPSKNKPVFVKRYTPKKVKVALKIAQDVGGVKRESIKLAEGLERAGFEVQRIRPSSKKWDADTFRKFTKYKGQTNEHARDAGKLVFQR